jgi:hypothetical protein
MDKDEFDFSSLLIDEDTADKTEVTTLESAKDLSMIFLTALKSECTQGEYDKLVTENAAELEAYGLIDNKEIATEAMKNVVRLNKFAKFAAVHKITAIKLAKANKDRNYMLYKKYRKLMVEARNKIYEKFGSRALGVARKTIANARAKASAIKSPTGRDITSKLQSHIEKLDKDQRNYSAINDKKPA